MIPYYLDENKHWGLSVEELQKVYDEYTKKGVTPKLLVVINPGNPTGIYFFFQKKYLYFNNRNCTRSLKY